MGNLIIIEGADGSGKSTLAQALKDRFCARGYNQTVIERHGPYPHEDRIGHHYLRSMRIALDDPSRVVIMDRCWLSEEVYGPTFRGTPSRISDAERRMLDRAALTCDATVILCLPDRERMLATWEMRRDVEYVDQRRVMSTVIDHYEALGDHPDRLLIPGAKSIVYDYARDSFEHLMDAIGPISMPLLEPFAGNKNARIMLIGDRANHPNFPRPFFGIENKNGCSQWLTKQLEEAFIPEHELLWANAFDTRGFRYPYSLFHSFLADKDAVFVLGKNAESWWNYGRLDLDLKKGASAYFYEHPQYWKRFHHGEKYPLVDRLAALLS